MSEETETICIICPVGCQLSVSVEDGKAEVSGNQCERGAEYGTLEALDPRRTVTSSVLVLGGEWPLASVRTSVPVPKKKVMEVMAAIRGVEVQAPVQIGDVVLENVAGSSADLVITREVGRR